MLLSVPMRLIKCDIIFFRLLMRIRFMFNFCKYDGYLCLI